MQLPATTASSERGVAEPHRPRIGAISVPASSCYGTVAAQTRPRRTSFVLSESPRSFLRRCVTGVCLARPYGGQRLPRLARWAVRGLDHRGLVLEYALAATTAPSGVGHWSVLADLGILARLVQPPSDGGTLADAPRLLPA